MGFFTNLFSSKPQKMILAKREVVLLIGIGNFELGIIGEEHHQAALEAISGQRLPRGVKRFETAGLVSEDENSVRVEIRGKKVGYLSRDAVTLFRQHLVARGKSRANGQCQAVISGGWISSDGRKGPYHVSLDIPNLDTL